MSLNKHIETYLSYYVSLQSPPNYAVLIKGKWGSGKSFFIKKFIEENKSKNYLYVSLYGISSFEDIETAFFKQMNPAFASEGMQFAGAVLKGLLKSTLKIDLNLFGDSKSDSSVSTVLPDIKIFESFKSSNNNILIFDDLERCSLPLNNVMGYINQLVENDNLKAIIIANEEEILKRSNSLNKPVSDNKNTPSSQEHEYNLIKEKLIGKTLTIEVDLESSINNFLNSLSNNEVKDLLLNNTSTIKIIFDTAKYYNLRHLKQAILDFERFLSFIPVSALTKIDLVKKVIEIFFAITFELKKGLFTEQNILDIFNLITYVKPDKDSYTLEVAKKYGVFDRHYNPLDSQIWYQYFTNNVIDIQAVEYSIYNSIYYYSEITPSWKKLKNFWNLDKRDFDILYQEVYQLFQEYKIEDKYVLLHIVDMFLFFSKNNIINYNQEDIKRLAFRNIEVMKSKNFLNLDIDRSLTLERNIGVEYLDKDNMNFNTVFFAVKDAIESTRSEAYSKIAEKLLDTLSKSIDRFESLLIINNNGTSKFQDTPILKYINVNDFLNTLWKLSPLDQRALGRVLSDRYIHEDFRVKLKDELSWMEELYTSIKFKNDK